MMHSDSHLLMISTAAVASRKVSRREMMLAMERPPISRLSCVCAPPACQEMLADRRRKTTGNSGRIRGLEAQAGSGRRDRYCRTPTASNSSLFGREPHNAATSDPKGGNDGSGGGT